MNLWKILGISKSDGPSDHELGLLFKGINDVLGDRDEDAIRRACAYAGLMGKVAYADMEVSDLEEKRIEKILKERVHLNAAETKPIVQLLREQRARLFSIEDYIYTRIINDLYDRNQKIEFLGALYSIAAADDSISSNEDSTIRTISQSLLLSHSDFIKARVEFKEFLEVLKT